ncbi:hypothetical protein GRJ2_000665700 [Grus japonensis]|uniref:Uncharacterized protein n=1 Tax=Grus japonensis TaxID=30415 RepID=A0ABC9WB28_GRUJA
MRTMEACPDPHMQLMLGDGEKKKTPIILIKMRLDKRHVYVLQFYRIVYFFLALEAFGDCRASEDTGMVESDLGLYRVPQQDPAQDAACGRGDDWGTTSGTVILPVVILPHPITWSFIPTVLP